MPGTQRSGPEEDTEERDQSSLMISLQGLAVFSCVCVRGGGGCHGDEHSSLNRAHQKVSSRCPSAAAPLAQIPVSRSVIRRRRVAEVARARLPPVKPRRGRRGGLAVCRPVDCKDIYLFYLSLLPAQLGRNVSPIYLPVRRGKWSFSGAIIRSCAKSCSLKLRLPISPGDKESHDWVMYGPAG